MSQLGSHPTPVYREGYALYVRRPHTRAHRAARACVWCDVSGDDPRAIAPCPNSFDGIHRIVLKPGTGGTAPQPDGHP